MVLVPGPRSSGRRGCRHGSGVHRSEAFTESAQTSYFLKGKLQTFRLLEFHDLGPIGGKASCRMADLKNLCCKSPLGHWGRGLGEAGPPGGAGAGRSRRADARGSDLLPFICASLNGTDWPEPRGDGPREGTALDGPAPVSGATSVCGRRSAAGSHLSPPSSGQQCHRPPGRPRSRPSHGLASLLTGD